jgi:D-alanyl-D-alanine dipeptidase
VSSWLDPVHSPLDGKTQLIAVTTAGWNSFRARLWRFERDAGEWREVGEAVDAVIGRAGYGWGRGLHGNGAPEGRTGPTKVEGDGKSPAGVFEVGAAYGYAEAQPRISLPYTQATAMLRCVDDPGSTHYNTIVLSNEVEVDWSSAEHMRREDDLYVLTIVVEHNSQEPEPGGGSCIFFHLWKGPDVGMSGCTAMSMGALEELAEWLKPGEAALVALPEKEYEAMRVPWGLPL